MKLIYIAHPFGGEQENVEKVEKIINCQHRFFNNYKRITINEKTNNSIDI